MSKHLDPVLLCDLLDDEITKEDREKAERHLAECDTCAALFADMIEARDILRSEPEVEVPEGLEDMILNAVSEEIRKEETSRVRTLRFVRWTAAAAAALVLVTGAATMILGGGLSGLTRGVSEASDRAALTASGEEWGIIDTLTEKNSYAMLGNAAATSDMAYDDWEDDAVYAAEPAEAPGAAVSDEYDGYYDDSEEDAAEPAAAPALSSGATEVAPNSKLVYTATVQESTYEFETDRQNVLNRISALGGYVQNGSVSGLSYEEGGYGRTASIRMRIPQNKYQEMMTWLSTVGTQDYMSESVEDITTAYTDETIRLENLKSQHEALLALMEETGSLEEYLMLQSELNDVATAIEISETNLRGMDLRTSYATIDLTLTEMHKIDEIPTDPSEETLGERIREALYIRLAGIRDGFRSFVVWFVSILPVVLILSAAAAIVLVIVLIVKKCKKH